MDVIAAVTEKLRRYPAVRYRVAADGGELFIEPPSAGGFSIWLVNDDPDWTVHVGEDGTHWHISDPQRALDLVGFCLSEDCRLVVEARTFQVVSRLEQRTTRGWETAWSQRLLPVIPLGRPHTTELFQNTLIPGRGTHQDGGSPSE